MPETTISGSPLSGKTLRELRARAHALKPVVWISEKGATEPVLREVDRALKSHELIKIHAAVDGRSAREELLESLCGSLGAQSVQVIGKMLVAYRPNPKPLAAEIQRPAAKSSATRKTAKAPVARKPAKNSPRPAKTSAASRPNPRAWPTSSRKASKTPLRRAR
jgi:RNA-binding protein